MSDHNPGLRPWRDILRRKSRQIMVGNVPVGGDAPITVQTMTNTLTSDPVATINQIRRCEEAGADIIRVSCPDEASTAALKQIVKAARVPIVADIHFHYKRAIEAAEAGAACLGNAEMERAIDRVSQLRIGGDREEHVACLHRDLIFVEILVLQQLDMVERAFDQRFGAGLAIFFEQVLFEAAGIDADADRAAIGLGRAHHFGDAL